MHLLVSYFPVSFPAALSEKGDYSRVLPNEILDHLFQYLEPKDYARASLISYQFYVIGAPWQKKFDKTVEKAVQVIFDYVANHQYSETYFTFLSTNLRVQVFPIVEQRFAVKITSRKEKWDFKIDTHIKNYRIKSYSPLSLSALNDVSFHIIEKIKSSSRCCFVSYYTYSREYVSTHFDDFLIQQLVKQIKFKIEQGISGPPGKSRLGMLKSIYKYMISYFND